MHLAGAGQVSWNGFAREIFRQAEIALPRRAGDAARRWPARRRARRGRRSQSEREDVLPMPDWRDGLAGYLAARAGMMRCMRLLVCGGAGFIGSTFVRQRLLEHGDEVTVLDKLTYAGREENFHDFAEQPRFRFVRGAIEDPAAVAGAIEAGSPEAIVNFAAETHVDRSIAEPDAFVSTHALGTYVLLEAAREHELRYLQVSTDEVYGSIEEGTFTEESPAAPVLALLGDQDRRGPARAELLPHLRAGGASSAAARTTTAPTSIPRS